MNTETKSILILQGGGALGAYECGVYQTLVKARRLDHLDVVAGTSIGAINASLIASHYHLDDHGAGYLQDFWTTYLTIPSFLYSPPIDSWQRWSAVWTSMLWGHPHLYTPLSPFPWFFRTPISWGSETHWYGTEAMEQTLRDRFGSYGPAKVNPRLIVTAVDIKKGEPVAFDSLTDCITAEHVVACGSLPPGFEAKQIQGKHYWDGGLWSNTPLRPVLNALQKHKSKETNLKERYQVYIVDLFPKQGSVPQNNWEVWQRMSEISYADRMEYGSKVTEKINEYIDLVKALHNHTGSLPPELGKKVESEYQKMCDERRAHLDITTIRRVSYPDEPSEHISRELDFSARRIEELLEQGRRDAQQTLQEETAEKNKWNEECESEWLEVQGAE